MDEFSFRIDCSLPKPSFKCLTTGLTDLADRALCSLHRGEPVGWHNVIQVSEHCGWLRKQGGRHRSLRSRWFEIKGDQLYYYRDNNEPKTPIASIPLPGNEVIKHPIERGDTGKFKFEIVSGKDKVGRPVSSHHETFLLIASSQREMEEWIRAINRIIYAPVGGGMFGRSLAETVKFEKRRGGGCVPLIVHKCVDFIIAHGLKEEGLFRLPGHVEKVASLKDAFNKGKNPELESTRTEVHSVASVLKSYFRELPEPLIPYDYFEVFLTAARCYEMREEDGIIAVQNQLKTLPQPNYSLLRFLCRFLHEVQKHCEQNKMNARNLAMVFGPNILRSGSEDPKVMMESTNLVTELISILIRKHELLFPQTDDEDVAAQRHNAGNDAVNLNVFEISAEYPRKTVPLASPEGEQEDDAVEDPRVQIEELENELELQQQQIKDLQTKLEQEGKVREMLAMRLADEQRARESAQDRLEKLQAAMEEFCDRYGNWEPTQR
ncbi:rho GTPase-activating protein 24-like isoform X1 [Acropora muricata]|uniref:rho GTPase-activating protein 24-like isoform X1 n=1 Tax=Acropora muricata TaxID=159855 RepID=UPI0034E378CE